MRCAPGAIVAPCSTRAIVRASAARTCAKWSRICRNRPARDNHYAVCIADDHVAGLDMDVAQGNRSTHYSGSVHRRRVRLDPLTEHRQSGRYDTGFVACQPVGDKARDTLVFHHSGSDITDHGGAGKGVIGDDDHIP
jgi:hypothetical protein